MTCTVVICKKNLSVPKTSFRMLLVLCKETFPEKTDSTIRVMEERAKTFSNVLSNKLKRKFQRDKIDSEKALNSSNKILKQLMNKTLVFNEKQFREKLLKGWKTPSFEPLNSKKMIHP